MTSGRKASYLTSRILVKGSSAARNVVNLFFQKALMEQGGADAGVKGDPYISRRVNKWFPHIGNQDTGAQLLKLHFTVQLPYQFVWMMYHPVSVLMKEERSILHR